MPVRYRLQQLEHPVDTLVMVTTIFIWQEILLRGITRNHLFSNNGPALHRTYYQILNHQGEKHEGHGHLPCQRQ